MKKQVLILMLFAIALIASTSTAFGQSLGASSQPIDPLTCVAGADQPLHPFAGVPYTYSLNGSNGAETAASYTWWATKDPNFITAEGTTNMATTALASPQVLNVSTTYGQTTPATTPGANTVSITWSADILAGTDYQGIPGPGTPTFVVGYAEGANCADNIQVYEINPMPNFTVDIAPIDPDNTATTLPWDDLTANLCVDEVQSASYNATSHELDINHGTNTIYFEVAAANFVVDWTPTFQIISGLRTSQTAVISMYATRADAVGTGTALWTSGSLAVGDMGTDIPTNTPLTASIPTDAFTGVSVYVKVVITNDTEESLTDNPFVLAVDAQDNSTGTARMWDMEDDDCTLLADAADRIDQATITVNPRPQLDHATVDTNVLEPNDRIVKTNP